MVPAHSIKVSRVSMYSGYRHVIFPFAYGAFTLSGRLSQNLSARINESIMRSEPHGARTMVWPLSISLAATLEIDFFFLFLRLLRCFSSPGSLPYVMDWRMDDWSSSSRVSPFRYLRLNGYLLLPAAFRSLSRLSSALSAKASTLRSFLLDLLFAVFHSVEIQGLAFLKTRLVNFFTVLLLVCKLSFCKLCLLFSDVLIKNLLSISV